MSQRGLSNPCSSLNKRKVTLLEESNVRELFEALFVADKYLLHQVIVIIEDKVEKFMIQEDNVGKAARSTIRLLVFLLCRAQ